MKSKLELLKEVYDNTVLQEKALENSLFPRLKRLLDDREKLIEELKNLAQAEEKLKDNKKNIEKQEKLLYDKKAEDELLEKINNLNTVITKKMATVKLDLKLELNKIDHAKHLAANGYEKENYSSGRYFDNKN